MSKQVWFGVYGRMSWVPAPLPGVGRNLTKWRIGGQYLNGGQWGRSSSSGARTHSLSWPVMTGAEVRQITTYLEGTYGPGPFYYSDPFAESANVLPPWLAAPWLACDDAPPMVPGLLPAEVSMPANTYNYPAFGAQYTVAGGGSVPGRYPVPPNTTAYVGFHGATTGTVAVKANTTTLTPLAVTTGTLTNFTYTAPSTGGWVTFTVTGTGTLTAYGMHMSFGTTGPTGSFVKGEGFTGLIPSDDPQITGYSAGGLDRQAITANFTEVEAWL